VLEFLLKKYDETVMGRCKEKMEVEEAIS